ncbi:MAG TPA: hypothetical protein VK614_02905 [Allosphingosinicella sp.]|nr:hypothetical protein [Allosphingosinicella sp.]
MLKRALAAATAAISLMAMQVSTAPAPAAAARDWSATLRADAQALHDDLAANHPGPVNPEDPGFARRNDEQLRLALRRAETAHGFPAYFYTLSAYVAAFDDGHLEFGIYGTTPWDMHWPGFLTAYQADGTQRVANRADDAPVPLGLRLLGCDGRPADRLAEANIGHFFGRWSLLSQRLTLGAGLFADDGNPYVRRPERCTFEMAGRRQEVTLRWQAIGLRDLIGRLQQASARPPREIAARTLADGTRWISIASFNADPRSPSGRALPSLLASLRADRPALVAAPAIVLDLRGNAGGSSDWSRQLAEIIWARAALDRLPHGGTKVDWRVSAANLASLRENRDRQIAGGALSPQMRRWFDRVTTGLADALARGQTLWREPEDQDETAAQPRDRPPVEPGPSGPVFFVTDAVCASACLDAVDLWRALGAVHVGQTTSADTFYMDVRELRLPSGLGGVSVPRKVYRGRARGANRPVVPVHAFAGDIGDTAALERWIAGLRERRH